MTPYLSDPDVTLYQGDALAVLRELPSESVHCIATSPPFYGLRDYGVDGQIGLESTPEEWAQKLVEVFREARRVLRKDGTLWVECGDSYNSVASNQRGERYGGWDAGMGRAEKRANGCKPKDLIGTPWLLAFALRADGWYLRSEIIWARPNPMPEAVTDRPTKAHSTVFLLSKSPRYFYDQEAIRQEAAPSTHERDQYRNGHFRGAQKEGGYEAMAAGDPPHRGGWNPVNPAGANARSVWTIPTEPTPFAHFATWPQKLVQRMILAACPEQMCSVCGKARERIVEQSPYPREATAHRGRSQWADGAGRNDGDLTRSGQEFNRWKAENPAPETWSDCGHNAYRPGVVLDPFAGSGTTLSVARKLGRRAIGIELNPSYCELVRERTQQQSIFA